MDGGQMVMVIPPYSPASRGASRSNARDRVRAQLHRVGRQQGADGVVDRGNPEQVGGERACERLGLEDDQVGPQALPGLEHSVDHVVGGDLREKPGHEVVLDALRGQAVAGCPAGARAEPAEP